MFTIADGRNTFYQWDLGRRVLVSDDTITQVHFHNGTQVNSLVCPVEAGSAAVPDELLQTAGQLTLYAFRQDHTLAQAVIPILPKARPEDYLYTPGEHLRYEALEERLLALEKGGAGIDAQPVADEEVLCALAESDLLCCVHDHTGILTDENHNILTW